MDTRFHVFCILILHPFCNAQNSQSVPKSGRNDTGNAGKSLNNFGNKNGGYGYKDGKYGYHDEFDFGEGTNVQNGSIIRPCPNMDAYCIRRYFARHAKCKPVSGPVPEPYYRPQANYFYPTFNISAVQTGVYYRGFQGVVEDFYLNNETDIAVLTVRFRNLRVNTTLDYYRYHRIAKEPAITKSASAAFFPSYTTTTFFRGIDNLKLARSETQGYLDAIPQAYIEPSAGEHPDPVVRNTFAAFLAGLLIALQEAQLTAAPWIAGTYIQHDICDYGLKLI